MRSSIIGAKRRYFDLICRIAETLRIVLGSFSCPSITCISYCDASALRIRCAGNVQHETGGASISSTLIPSKSKPKESQKTQQKSHWKRLRKKIHLCDNYLDNVRDWVWGKLYQPAALAVMHA